MTFARLIAALDTPRDREAEAAIARLVRVGAPIMPDLIATAQDRSRPRVRRWSLQALGAIADPRAAKVLGDERMTVRLHAVCGLGRMRHRPAAKALARGTKPTTLACMHGSSWRGAGERLLLALGDVLDR